MKKALVTGVGRYLPERKITTEEMEEMAGYDKFGVRYGLCKMLTGCETRYYAAEDEYSSDLSMKASLKAMEQAGVQPSDIDAVLFCSITQDFAEPATANVVADKLDIRNAYVFDVKKDCNAFMSGVDLADSLIKTGKAETILVTSGEALSKWIRRGFDSKEELMEKAPVTLSMGDAGGAYILQAGKIRSEASTRHISTHLRTCGTTTLSGAEVPCSHGIRTRCSFRGRPRRSWTSRRKCLQD